MIADDRTTIIRSDDRSRHFTQTKPPAPGAIAVYFALTFLVAWLLWLAAAAVTPSSWSIGTRGLFYLPGTFAPAIVALWLTARDEGGAGISLLLRRVVRWEVHARWYLFAISYMAGIKLAAAVASRAITGEWPAFSELPLYLLFIGAILSTPFQAGEEIGWRGYALPRLASRMGLARASILLGVIWALWHLPLFVIPGTTTSGQNFSMYLIAVTAVSVPMAWLYARTGGSLLLVMLMHSAINNTTGIVPSRSADAPAEVTIVSWLTAALLWIGAAFFLARMPAAIAGPPGGRNGPNRAAEPPDWQQTQAPHEGR